MEPEEKKYSIPEAAKYMCLTEQYIRMLVRIKRLKTELLPIAPLSQVFKHWVTKTEMDRFLSSNTTRTRRTDKRNKYLIYMTDAEKEVIMKDLESRNFLEVASLIKLANKNKTKAKAPKQPAPEEKGGPDAVPAKRQPNSKEASKDV